MEFVIINCELIEKKSQKNLYGFIELNVDSLPRGSYKHQLRELLTSDDIYQQYQIQDKDLPEGTRSTLKFQEAIPKNTNPKITTRTLKGIMTEKPRPKYDSCKQNDVDYDKETNIILEYLAKWKKKMLKNKEVMAAKDLIPLLIIDKQNSGCRADWAHLVRIKPFGYDVAVVFRDKKDTLEFKKVLLDLEEVKSKHRLCGINIAAMEKKYNLQPGHWKRLLDSKKTRKQQMKKTTACLVLDEWIRESPTIKCEQLYKNLHAKQQILSEKDRNIKDLKEKWEESERDVVELRLHNKEYRESRDNILRENEYLMQQSMVRDQEICELQRGLMDKDAIIQQLLQENQRLKYGYTQRRDEREVRCTRSLDEVVDRFVMEVAYEKGTGTEWKGYVNEQHNGLRQ